MHDLVALEAEVVPAFRARVPPQGRQIGGGGGARRRGRGGCCCGWVGGVGGREGECTAETGPRGRRRGRIDPVFPVRFDEIQSQWRESKRVKRHSAGGVVDPQKEKQQEDERGKKNLLGNAVVIGHLRKSEAARSNAKRSQSFETVPPSIKLDPPRRLRSDMRRGQMLASWEAVKEQPATRTGNKCR